MNFNKLALELHRDLGGKISVNADLTVRNADDLSLAYTPGVAAVCEAIRDDRKEAAQLTIAGRTVAVVTDGTAVLGLGNIGPAAAMPVMEGKCLLLKELGGINAWPLCMNVNSDEELIAAVKAIAPSFAGILLEDIGAPRCFVVEDSLQDLGIPVWHDDQHGTAIVAAAAAINATRALDLDWSDHKVVIAGAGAAGIAIGRLFMSDALAETMGSKPKDVILCDRKGAISSSRTDLTDVKQKTLAWSNQTSATGTLVEAAEGATIIIGVSGPGAIPAAAVSKMADNAIVFALANPIPEIMPDDAFAAGAVIVGTGRSDLPNQINNVLAFPGVFKGMLDAGAQRVTDSMKSSAAYALAMALPVPSPECILPAPLDPDLPKLVAAAVTAAYKAS